MKDQVNTNFTNKFNFRSISLTTTMLESQRE